MAATCLLACLEVVQRPSSDTRAPDPFEPDGVMSDERSSSQATAPSRSAILHDVAAIIRRCRDSSDSDVDLAAAARLLCDDTRRRELPIERAIIDLKTALLSEIPDLTPSDTLSATRSRVIQLTIEEYYRP